VNEYDAMPNDISSCGRDDISRLVLDDRFAFRRLIEESEALIPHGNSHLSRR